MVTKPSQSTPFDEYVRLLCALHELISAGQGDSEQADAIREAMDRPWHLLSSAEISRADWLSEDLYSLDATSAREPSPESSGSSPGELLVQVVVSKDLDELLKLLRSHADQLPFDRMACLRAFVWMSLQHPEPARLFLQGAAHAALRECVKALATPAQKPKVARRRASTEFPHMSHFEASP